jgi:hypothetical protein
MVNLDPDSAKFAPEVPKAIMRANQNNAGIYGAVTRIGRLVVGHHLLPSGDRERARRRRVDAAAGSEKVAA